MAASTVSSASLSLSHNDRNPITMTRFLMQERQQFKEATGNFAMLLQSIQLACKVISAATRKAGIAQLTGLAGDSNASGDAQKKLDVFANDVMVNCVRFSNQVFIIGSEENDEPIILDNAAAGYAIVFDPLDGSSNIDCNLSVGTIFGIYKKEILNRATSVKDLLRSGNQLIAAGYASYDAATMMVLTTGNGVNGFTLDPQIGEFILTHQNIRIPTAGKTYSINEANSLKWDEATKHFIEQYKASGKASSRYVGSMVGDIHRTLLYGGIFCYPGDSKSPNGKLRLLYECNPISMIVEQAGGKATTGTQRILDLQPQSLHGRCPIFAGSKIDVEMVEEAYRKIPSKHNAIKSKM